MDYGSFQEFVDGELPKLKASKERSFRINMAGLVVGGLIGIALYYGLGFGNLWVNVPVTGLLAFIVFAMFSGGPSLKVIDSLTDTFASLSPDDQIRYLGTFWEANKRHYQKESGILTLRDMADVFGSLFWKCKCWDESPIEEQLSFLFSAEVKGNCLRWKDSERILKNLVAQAGFDANRLSDFLVRFYKKFSPSEKELSSIIDDSGIDKNTTPQEQRRILMSVIELKSDDKWVSFFNRKYPHLVFDAAKQLERFDAVTKEHGIVLSNDPKQWNDESKMMLFSVRDFVNPSEFPFAYERVYLGTIKHVGDDFAAWLNKESHADYKKGSVSLGARPLATVNLEDLLGKGGKRQEFISKLDSATEKATKGLSDKYDVMEKGHRNTKPFIATYDSLLKFNDDYSKLTVVRVAFSGRYESWADRRYESEGVLFVLEETFSETELLDSKMEIIS